MNCIPPITTHVTRTDTRVITRLNMRAHATGNDAIALITHIQRVLVQCVCGDCLYAGNDELRDQHHICETMSLVWRHTTIYSSIPMQPHTTVPQPHMCCLTIAQRALANTVRWRSSTMALCQCTACLSATSMQHIADTDLSSHEWQTCLELLSFE